MQEPRVGQGLGVDTHFATHSSPLWLSRPLSKPQASSPHPTERPHEHGPQRQGYRLRNPELLLLIINLSDASRPVQAQALQNPGALPSRHQCPDLAAGREERGLPPRSRVCAEYGPQAPQPSLPGDTELEALGSPPASLGLTCPPPLSTRPNRGLG